MSGNIQLDEGSSGKFTHTEERAAGVHNQVVELNVGGAAESLWDGQVSGRELDAPQALSNGEKSHLLLDPAGRSVVSQGALSYFIDSVLTYPVQPRVSSVTSVAGSASNVVLLVANYARKAAMFWNDSSAILYLKLGQAATTSSYSVQLPAGGFFELKNPVYQGQIDGIWAAANGSLRVTELT